MKKYMYWLLPLFWMGVIYYASATPYQEQDIKPFLSETINLSFLEPIFKGVSFQYHNAVVSVEELGIEGFVEFFIRKGAHVTVYFILLVLFYIAFRKTTRTSFTYNLVISFVLTSIYAISDEFHQGFTQNRTPYIGDVGLDIIGASIGCLIILIVSRWRGNASHRTGKG